MCTLPNFVKDDQFLEGLKFELLDQIFYEKNNDLYTFQQVRINILIGVGRTARTHEGQIYFMYMHINNISVYRYQ